MLLFMSTASVFSCDNKSSAINKITSSKQSTASNNYGYSVKIGDTAPDFELPLTSGDTIKLSSLRGKVVMVQFTASWCGVCRKEMPYIETDIWQKYKNREDFVLIGIDIENDIEKIKKLKSDIPITYPLAIDADKAVFEKYTIPNAGVTRNIIVDKNGKIVFLTRLFKMEEFKQMCEVIAKLLEN